MKYADFIAELETLIDEGRAISTAAVTHKNQRFRKWRHDAESIVEDAKARGFRLPGEFNSKHRSYRAMWVSASNEDNVEALRVDLGDCIVELEFMVQQYRKFGAPQPPTAAISATALLAIPAMRQPLGALGIAAGKISCVL